ncbi:MAG: fatty acid hydroxylase [Sphingobacteriales bacterium]|nr:fatty acid hydroxylase [Sphingobacteriales bacterium]
MVGFSCFIHKYLFHSLLWFIHKTHHKSKANNFFEWNDIFSFGFAAFSIYLIIEGSQDWSSSFWIGIGISLYRIIYFVLHDLSTHARFRTNKPRNAYIKAIIRAHKIHHKSIYKHPSEEFGLLLVSKKYLHKGRQLIAII